MKNKAVQFFRKPFIRNVIIMASGTAAAQVITMSFSPIITRIYGPEAFGILGVFIAIVGVTAPIAALTYPIAIVLPKRESEAKGLAKLSLLISLIIALFFTVLIFFLKDPIIEIFKLGAISSFLFLIPFVILFSSFLQVIEQWLIRTKQFSVTAKVSFLHALILQGSKVGVGLIYPTASILIIINTLGSVLKGLLMLIGKKNNRERKNIQDDFDKVSLKDLAIRYKDFPMYRAPEVFINAISQNMPILLLTGFFGPSSAGFYTIATSVLAMPAQLLGKSVGDVFYPHISEAANKGVNIEPLIKKATLALSIVGIVPFGTIILWGPSIFTFIFGVEWTMAGEYARWIALWTFFMFLNRPSIKALAVINAQALHLRFTIITLLVRFIVLLIGFYVYEDDLMAVALFGISGALLNIFMLP